MIPSADTLREAPDASFVTMLESLVNDIKYVEESIDCYQEREAETDDENLRFHHDPPIPTTNFTDDEHEPPLSFTRSMNPDTTNTTTQYTSIPFAFQQTLKDIIQVPVSYLCQTDTPSDINDLWASLPLIEKQPRTYRKIWGYGLGDREVFTWITIDGWWLCKEPDDDEEDQCITFKELPFPDHVDDTA